MGIDNAITLHAPEEEAFMSLALEQAHKAEECGEVPVGAVIINEEGTVIATGYNQPITTNDPTAHAEIQAIRAAGKAVGNYRLPGCTMFVTLEPCPMCMGALIHARIKKLIIGAPDPRTGAAGSVLDLGSHSALNHRIEVKSGILETECSSLLKQFFKNKRVQNKEEGGKHA
jgi:tRNA(adenine34) deaminase